MWFLLTAYSVTTVFGADVPLGRLLVVWIAGLARQRLLSVQGGPPALPGSGGGVAASLMYPLSQPIISRCGRPASPGRMVRMSVPGAIWLALMPYVASNCGVATYRLPVKFCTPCSGRPTRHRSLVDSSFTAVAWGLGASRAALIGVICPGPELWAAPTVTWLLDRSGPIQFSGLSNLMLATTQIPMARNTANVVAPRAAPDRAR